MEHRVSHLVSRAELEAHLAGIARSTPDPRAGIFGPASMTWRVSRESAVFLGAGRAALLQLAHPWVSEAIAQHSNLLGDPIARFHNTFRVVFTMIFGSLDQAFAAARHLHTLHTGIRGELSSAVASWPEGAHYEANELSALRWVFATLIESAVLAHTCVLPLSPQERERYYNESKTLAALFGIPAASLPENWAAFVDYNQAMLFSGLLGVSPAARSMAHAILRGAGSWIPVPGWYRALTAEWMPPTLREAFALEDSAASVRSAERARRRLPRVWKMLPASLRYVGPWHEAQARLRDRSPGIVSRLSNRFWIGKSHLPFQNQGQSYP